MKTPIYDFVKRYNERDFVRLHMPGHKGKGILGAEAFDITEILGADDLNSPCGIIAESEQNATETFETGRTIYSTEGSTAVIKTMLSLVCEGDKPKKILAGRNAHKALLYAAALLDLEVEWMVDRASKSLCSFSLGADDLKAYLEADADVAAVYVTSPDYLGNMLDIKSLAAVCDEFCVPLLVDNAHGAYLKFLNCSLHPIEQGATMCCDSAHKTLPVLTGGAYLHISKGANERYKLAARQKMNIFCSTSPSYLILQSLDLCNKYIADGFCEDLGKTVEKVSALKQKLSSFGFKLVGTEPLKITVDANFSGYSGIELADILRGSKIEPEYADNRFVCMMFSVNNSDADFERLEACFKSIKVREPIALKPFIIPEIVKGKSIRNAVLAESETLKVEKSLGRVCAAPAVSCPPAVPIVISGEVITEAHIKLFKYYGIETVEVLVPSH